jgi:very-short-patch-repair endonuclease
VPLRNRTIVARRLRRNAPNPERLLWYALQQNRFPWKFRRQHPIGRRIADFACPARKLVIELDGGHHANSLADELRSDELAQHGYRVIRFWNHDVIENIEGVLELIGRALEVPPPHLTSPPPGAERKRK